MSNQKKPAGISWTKAAEALQAKVKFVLQQAQNNRYSVSRIYAAYNAVFELQEAPQTCSTCLTSRVAKLRTWWHDNAPKDTESVPTTGDDHQGANKPIKAPAAKAAEVVEAEDYDAVVKKYGIKFDEESEGKVLADYITAGVSAPIEGGVQGITENELELIRQRAGELTAASEDAALKTLVTDKLNALGVTKDSPDEDALEAYEALASDETVNTPNEQAFYVAQIEILKREIAEDAKQVDAKQVDPADGVRVIDMGEGVLGMHFTPSAEDAAKGTILNADGTKVKAGTYTAADGTIIAVQPVGGKATIKQQ